MCAAVPPFPHMPGTQIKHIDNGSCGGQVGTGTGCSQNILIFRQYYTNSSAF